MSHFCILSMQVLHISTVTVAPSCGQTQNFQDIHNKNGTVMFMSVQRRATCAPPSLFFTDSTQKYVNTQTRHPCACWTLHNPGCSPPHFGICLAAGIFHEAISSSSVYLISVSLRVWALHAPLPTTSKAAPLYVATHWLSVRRSGWICSHTFVLGFSSLSGSPANKKISAMG